MVSNHYSSACRAVPRARASAAVQDEPIASVRKDAARVAITHIPPEGLRAPKLGYTLNIVELIAGSLSINVLSLALPLITLQVYDRIVPYQNQATLNMLCIGAALVALVDMGLRLARAYATGWAGATFEHTVATNAVRHVLEQDVTTLEELGIGEHLQRISAVSKVKDFVSGQVLMTLIDLPFVLVFLGLITYFSGLLVIVPITLLVIFSLSAWMLGRALKQSLRARDEADNGRYGFIVKALNGIHTVKGLGLEAVFERRFEHWQAKTTIAHYHAARLNVHAFDQGVLYSHIMMLLVAASGAVFVIHGTISLGTLIACVLLSGRVMQPVQRAFGLWTRLQDIELAQKKIQALFATSSTPRTHSESETLQNSGTIEFKNVSFRYKGHPSLLKNISLRINPGDTIALYGEHGAGKHTLFKLASGLLRPHSGMVLINGMEAHHLSAQELVQNVGFLPPTSTIFRGTIYDNLSRFGAVPEERVMEISKLMGIHQQVILMPAGYDTKLEGTAADPIPPGLRQRITIARVLAMKPRLLLFYNADRALDKEGYNALYSLLGKLKGRVTMLFVCNDRNMLAIADKHYDLIGGKLVERQTQKSAATYEIATYQELRL